MVSSSFNVLVVHQAAQWPWCDLTPRRHGSRGHSEVNMRVRLRPCEGRSSTPGFTTRWSRELKSSLALYLNPAAMSLTRTLRLERHSPAGHGTAQQRDPWLFNGSCQDGLPSKCFIFWTERTECFLCGLGRMNFDKSNVGQSALYCRTVI